MKYLQWYWQHGYFWEGFHEGCSILCRSSDPFDQHLAAVTIACCGCHLSGFHESLFYLGEMYCERLLVEQGTSAEEIRLLQHALYLYRLKNNHPSLSVVVGPSKEQRGPTFECLNPSIAVNPITKQLETVVRTTNFQQHKGSYSSKDADGIIRTRNYINLGDGVIPFLSVESPVILNLGDGVIPSLSVESPVTLNLGVSVEEENWIEIKTPLIEYEHDRVQGLEDCRLVIHPNGSIRYLTSSVYGAKGAHPNQKVSLFVSTLQGTCITDMKRITGIGDEQTQKNWLPFCNHKGKLWAIYHYFPKFVVVEINPSTGVAHQVIEKDWTNQWNPQLWRGSAGPVFVDNHVLVLVHEVLFWKGTNERVYFHRLLCLDLNWNLVNVSKSFWFGSNERNSQSEKAEVPWIEYGAGMAWHNNRLWISFGKRDCEARLISWDWDQVCNLFLFE